MISYLRQQRALFALALSIGALFAVPVVAHAGLGSSLSSILIAIVGFLLQAAAGLFDSAVNLFILDMGSLVGGNTVTGNSISASIDRTWTIVRDLVNLTFIFGLIYVGFRTILNTGTDTKKMLASILVGALLVNFSLFISKVVIDVSNVTATEIYQKMGIGESTDPRLQDVTLGEVIMARMGLVQLVSVPNVSNELVTRYGASIEDTDEYIMFVIGGTIFILVATFVFAAAAILLAIRFGVLILLMILSPIAFAAAVFPAMSGWSSRWWRTLFSQAFFAPAFLFMLYITLAIAEGYQSKVDKFDQIFSGEQAKFQEGFGAAAFFAITIVMMVASLILAKQMGAVGAGRAMAVGNYLRGTAQGYAGRKFIGQPLDWADREMEKRGISSTNPLRSIASAGANAKFGSRHSRVQVREAGEKATQKAARYDQVQKISAAARVGASETTDRAVRQRNQVAMERAVTGASTEQLVEILSRKKPGDVEYDAIVRSMSASQFDAVMKAKPEELDDAAKAALGAARGVAVQNLLKENARKAAGEGVTLTDEEALQRGIKNASAAQLKALGADMTFEQAHNLKQSQVDDIMKGADFTETQKNIIRERREDKFLKSMDTNPKIVFEGKKAAEIAKLPKKILLDIRSVPYLDGEVLRRIQDGDELTADERYKLADNITHGSTKAKQSALAYLDTPRGRNYMDKEDT